MFFIGVFGIQDKDEYIGTYNNIVCPSCGRLARYEIHKSYRYFHVFSFDFRWNVSIVKTSCCGRIYELILSLAVNLKILTLKLKMKI